MDALERYSEIITPWATKVAENFTADLTRQNEKVWRQHSKNISRELRNLVESAPVGQVMQSIIAEQVKYIKSLPLEAAARVYDIQNRATEAVVTGGRAEHFAKEIAASGDIAKSRADLIARTELGRATGALDQARALLCEELLAVAALDAGQLADGALHLVAQAADVDADTPQQEGRERIVIADQHAQNVERFDRLLSALPRKGQRCLQRLLRLDG